MNGDELFQLWGRVLKGDARAKDEFVRHYLVEFPHNAWLAERRTPEDLHIMYLHLTK